MRMEIEWEGDIYFSVLDYEDIFYLCLYPFFYFYQKNFISLCLILLNSNRNYYFHS